MSKFLALFLALSFPISVLAFTVPSQPSSFVSDYAHIILPEEVSVLENKIKSFERETSGEIAIVTIPSLDGDTIENIAQEIFTKWGIVKEDKDNGVLLLISIGDRETR